MKAIRKISFVIPCYNSSKTIGKVIAEIKDTMEKLKKYEYEVILVNDCSPDNTFEVIEQLCEEYSNICGVNLAKNFGQHGALMAGFHQVTGDVLVCLDDDGQTPADEVGKLLEKIEAGDDVTGQNGDQSRTNSSGHRSHEGVHHVLQEVTLDQHIVVVDKIDLFGQILYGECIDLSLRTLQRGGDHPEEGEHDDYQIQHQEGVLQNLKCLLLSFSVFGLPRACEAISPVSTSCTSALTSAATSAFTSGLKLGLIVI